MSKKEEKAVHVPVVEEGVIRVEDITDPESMMIGIQMLVQWALNANKGDWRAKKGTPIAVVAVLPDADQFAKAQLVDKEGNQQHTNVRSRVTVFCHGMSPQQFSESIRMVVMSFLQTKMKEQNND